MGRSAPDDDTLAEHLLGPTGNMRAPLLQLGKTVVVGYDHDVYDELLG